jgi:hypothetical protein
LVICALACSSVRLDISSSTIAISRNRSEPGPVSTVVLLNARDRNHMQKAPDPVRLLNYRKAHVADGLLARRGDAVEEINDSRLQGIFGPNHDEAAGPDHLLKNLRSMAQMIRRSAYVGPNSAANQGFRIVPEVSPKQHFHGGSDAIHNRAQVTRLVFSRLLDLFQSGRYGTALRMPEDYHQPRAKACSGELDATHLGRSNNVSGNADDEEIPQALIEHYLSGHARIGASKDRRERLLRAGERAAASLAREVPARNARQKPTISVAQAFQGFYR